MCIQDSGGAPAFVKIGIRFSEHTRWQVTSYSYAGTEGSGLPYYTEEGFCLTAIQRDALEKFFKSDDFSEACCDSTGLVAILICKAHDKPEDYRALTIGRGNQIFLKLV